MYNTLILNGFLYLFLLVASASSQAQDSDQRDLLQSIDAPEVPADAQELDDTAPRGLLPQQKEEDSSGESSGEDQLEETSDSEAAPFQETRSGQEEATAREDEIFIAPLIDAGPDQTAPPNENEDDDSGLDDGVYDAPTIPFSPGAAQQPSSDQEATGQPIAVPDYGQTFSLPREDEKTRLPQSGERKVVLRALEKITARTIDMEVDIDETVAFKSLEITLRTCDKRPPEEPPETSAFLEISDAKPDGERTPVFTGWMFASSPALSALEHPVYDVWVIDCIIAEPVVEAGNE